MTLDGTASLDPDGTIASYVWEQIEGASVHLSNSASAKPTFVAPSYAVSANVKFKLTVKDDHGASASATVLITVDRAPLRPPRGDAGQGSDSATTGCSSSGLSGIELLAAPFALGALRWRRRR